MDRTAWNDRWREREQQGRGEPNRFLVEAVVGLEPGTALDLAAGSGRNAVWLAGLGWSVTAVDWSDVAIDQGGCFETSKETTHSSPTYIVDGIVHYAVSNMPGALPETSSVALTNATLSYALEIAANRGVNTAVATQRSWANRVVGEPSLQALFTSFSRRK